MIAAAIIGIALLSMPVGQSRPLMDLLAPIQAVCMVIVRWVLHFAPLTEIAARLGTGRRRGTAIYQRLAAIFLAQVLGVEIGMAGILLIVVMATGAAIGAPGTPGGGIVILAVILASVGIPAADIAIMRGPAAGHAAHGG